MPDTKITLFAYATSPYAAKVAAALHYKGLAFDVVHVDPLTKKELKFAHPKVVPTLRIGNEWRQDSTDLCLWIDQLFPEKPLCGNNDSQKSKILEIDHWVSENYMPALFRELIHWDDSYRVWVMDRWRYGIALHRSKNLPWMVRLSWPWAVQWTGFIRSHAKKTSWKEPLPKMRKRLLAELVEHLGQGPFLGEMNAPSLADLAIFPSMVVPYLIGLQKIELWQHNDQIIAWLKNVAKSLPEHPFLIHKSAINHSLDCL